MASSGHDSNQEINQIWRQVELRVVQMAGGDPAKINQTLDIFRVLSQIDQIQARDKKAAKKYSAIKSIFNQTLQCIQTVGGIVAAGASTAFAPASLCHNALTFVISAWQGYEGIFDSLASLLEKCTEFLDRLTYYTAANMDTKLTRVACQHLQIFVEICDYTLKLRQKRNKLAAFMKQLFLNDAGIQGLLSSMESLVDKERGLVAAQTWKSSNEAAENSRDGLILTRKVHNTLQEGISLSMREKELFAWKQTITNALECDQTVLDPEGQSSWEETWKNHKANILEGSGKWLLEDSTFNLWIEGSDNSTGFLMLRGEDGAGKTLLASNIILHLRQGKLSSLDCLGTRIKVAHFLNTAGETSDPVHHSNFILRVLMLQLALSDEPFMKSAATICDDSKFFSNSLDMWNQLILRNRDLESMNITFFIVLDGLQSNMGPVIQVLRQLSSSSPQIKNKFRVFLTGPQKLFQSLNLSSFHYAKIDLGVSNKQDLSHYINSRMDGMETLVEKSRPGILDIREKILTELINRTKGDYYKINRVLDNISKTDNVEEIHSFLHSAGITRPNQIEDDIKQLNESRSAKEIKEIIEIMLWITGGRVWFQPDIMEGAIELGIGATARSSLMSLRNKIKSKYVLFSVKYDGTVDFKLKEIQQKIPLKMRAVNDWDSISLDSDHIRPRDIEIMKHYLLNVCPKDLYQLFGFDEFFDGKLVKKGIQIHQDPDNLEISLVIRCLRCLTEKRNTKTRQMKWYSQNWLLSHLEATDLSLADRELKAEAGVLLLRLFTEPHAFNTLLDLHSEDFGGPPYEIHKIPYPNYLEQWVCSDAGVHCVTKWFKDSAVIEYVKEDPLVVAFKNAPAADRHLVLFQNVMKCTSELLFRTEPLDFQTVNGFWLLYSLLSKNGKELKGDIHEPTYEMLEVVENWAQTALGYEDRDATWEAQTCSLIHLVGNKNIDKSIAEERARKALELDQHCWRAAFALSRVITSKENAIDLLENVIEGLWDDKEWREQERNKATLATILFELGRRYWESEERDEDAIAAFSKLLKIGRSDAVLINFAEILSLYDSRNLSGQIVDFFYSLLKEPEPGINTTGAFMSRRMRGAWAFRFREIIARALKATNRCEIIDILFQKANETEPESDHQFWHHIHHGYILSQLPGYEEAGVYVYEQAAKISSTAQKSILLHHQVVSWTQIASKKTNSSLNPENFKRRLEVLYAEHERTILGDDYLTYLFGRYFRHLNDEFSLMKLMRDHVRDALEMLADDDLLNDGGALWILVQTFAFMHDLPNLYATAELMELVDKLVKDEYDRQMSIWGKIQSSNSNAKEVLTTNDDAEAKAAETPLDANPETRWYRGKRLADKDIVSKPEYVPTFDITCHGCGVDCPSLSGLWVCLTEGAERRYDNACYNSLQAGNLPIEGCDKGHEFVQIPTQIARAISSPQGFVTVGNEAIAYDTWKSRVRAQYVDFE